MRQSFGLDDDERVIAETAAAFAEKRLAPNALEWDKSHHFPVDELREAAELGMAAIYCGEDAGGSGLRRIDAVRIFEQLAAADPTVAAFLSIHNMCSWMVDTYGTHEQRKSWVPKLASMEAIASYCLTEPGAGSDAGALRTKAVRDGDHYVLDGVKQFISGAGESDVYVVMARTGGDGPRGISAFIVEKGTPGLSFGANEEKMGWHAQPTAQVIFEGVRVPVDAMLGGAEGEGTGFSIAMNGLNGGRINIAACSLGGAQAAYDKAAGYLADRQAFGGALLDEPTIRFSARRHGHGAGDVANAVVAGGNCAGRQPPRQGGAVRDGEALRHRRLLRRRRSGATAARRLRLSQRVRAGEDRPRSAGAPNPRGNQRNHARGHRSGRSRPGPRLCIERSEA